MFEGIQMYQISETLRIRCHGMTPSDNENFSLATI